MICFPFDSKNIGSEQDPIWDRAITSKMERELNKLTWTNGVFMSPVDSLLVSAGSGLRVKVAKGGCHIEGARGYQETDKYLSLSRGTSQPRIDRVVVRFDNSENERNIDIHIKEGTPSASPVAPELVRQSNIYELALADVKVKAGASGIEAVDITDLRANAKVCGFVLPAIPNKQPTEKLWAQINESIKTVESALKGTALGDVRSEISTLKSKVTGMDAKLSSTESKVTTLESNTKYVTSASEGLRVKLNNNTVADVVVSITNIDSGLKCYKYASGRVSIIGTINHSTGTFSGTSGIYYSHSNTLTRDFSSYLKEIYHIGMSVINPGGGVVVCNPRALGLKVEFDIIRFFGGTTSLSATYGVHIEGRWK